MRVRAPVRVAVRVCVCVRVRARVYLYVYVYVFCIIETCKAPSNIPHVVRRFGDDVTNGSVMTYSCAADRHRFGDGTTFFNVTCQDGVWVPAVVPKCVGNESCLFVTVLVLKNSGSLDFCMYVLFCLCLKTRSLILVCLCLHVGLYNCHYSKVLC
jgi:hypothetical protein